MGRLRTFVFVSLFCHFLLALVLVDVHFSGSQSDASDVYQVAIVAGPPAGDASAPGDTGISQARKFLYRKGGAQAAIGEITKEKALKGDSPEFSPSAIKPERPMDSSPDVPGAGSPEDAKPITQGKGQLTGVAGGGASSEVALWKARIRGMVETLWRPPPEIQEMDMSLKTTYLLRVTRVGDLLQKKLLVPSGNAPFDRSVLTALSRVTRFPPPPLVLIAGGNWVEVTMSFTPPKGAR
ncbi:MAG: TonB C-terminal domain-containing protein [Deltaproteobacteria bacterium]|nr:TonB C-terminal domain-containing protein [Deltaproteobacteria bacterium]